MRLSQPRQLFAALLVSLAVSPSIAAPINTGFKDLIIPQRRILTPPQPGQVTPPGQVDGSPGSNPSPVGAPMKTGLTTSYALADALAE